MPPENDVFVVGSVNVDLVLRTPARPGPGETVLGNDLTILSGGKGANQAVAASRLGGRVALLARVGDDAHGEFLRTELVAAGVEPSLVLTTPGSPSGVAVITVTPNGENSIIVSPGANWRLTPEDVDAAAPAVRASKALALQMELPVPTVERAAAVAEAGGVRVVLNLAPAGALPAEVMAVTNPVVVNEQEAAALMGRAIPDVDAALRACTSLLDFGPRSVVVTLGSAGAVHVEAGAKPQHVPAPKVPVVDATGAGDAFVGALTLELGRGATLGDAVRLAVRVGTSTVRRTGAQGSMPTRLDLETP